MVPMAAQRPRSGLSDRTSRADGESQDIPAVAKLKPTGADDIVSSDGQTTIQFEVPG
jgi:hypothetical protein